MKTTLDLPGEVLKDAKATAAARGETLRHFVTLAIEARLHSEPRRGRRRPGWRALFGLARRAELAPIDRVISRDLETIDPADWR